MRIFADSFFYPVMTIAPKALRPYSKTINSPLCMNPLESIDTVMYEMASYTVSNFNKEKNGDECKVSYIKEEHLLLAVLSDGVSQQPCDWYASELVCEGFVKYFKASDQNLSIEQRMFNSILSTNNELLEVQGECGRLAATLSVCVVDEQNHEVYWSSIGDSRIYLVFSDSVQQVTRDDVTEIKQVISSSKGSRVISQMQLTSCMGQGNIAPKIQSGSLIPQATLVLASDGFYDARKASFFRKMIDFQREENFEASFTSLISSFEIMRDDDMSVIAIRRKP